MKSTMHHRVALFQSSGELCLKAFFDVCVFSIRDIVPCTDGRDRYSTVGCKSCVTSATNAKLVIETFPLDSYGNIVSCVEHQL